MLSVDLLKEWALSDPARRLQQTSREDEPLPDAYVIMMWIVGIVIIDIVLAYGCFRIFMCPMCARARQLPSNNRAYKTQRKSTLAERKLAILDLFEKSHVSMVSTNDSTMMARAPTRKRNALE